jgi:ABC-type antimicrobial peptide transport system permease subunit
VIGVDDVQPLSEIYFKLSLPGYIGGSLPVLVGLGVLLFAIVGIYTRMSFDVVERRREIGIRSALGASPWKLVMGIFRSVFGPVLIGMGLGGAAALALNFYLTPLLFGSTGGRPLPWILPVAEGFVVLVGLAAISGPILRTFRTDAMDALRQN